MKPLITNTSHWKIIENYLAVEIASLVTRLQTCTEADLKKIQGELAALRKIEALPDQLKTEQRSR
jgi:hypothetical protein